jgi:signal transduction histidine kinase
MAFQAREAGIQLRFQATDHLPSIPMEAESIHRCLLNLVANAVDACVQQRETNPHIDQAPIELTCSAAPNGIEYRVKDCCGGMTKQVQSKLFETFFTTKGSRGTGIGLMLSRKIITAHHGRIEVDAQPGVGSTFTVWLPDRQPPGKK